jgi:hypothetical protein
MSKPDAPDGSLGSEEEAKLRILRRIASKPERDAIDELAAALLEEADSAGPAPISHRRRQEK